MYKYLTLLFLLLSGCRTLPVDCMFMAQAQYDAAAYEYGKDNVQMWRMKNDDPSEYTYHNQVKIRPDGKGGKWYWVPNRLYTEFLQRDPQKGCKPLGRIK